MTEPITNLTDAVAALGALPIPVGPEPRTLDQVEDELTGVSLSLYEEELETARLRLALKSAQRGRRDLRSDVEFLVSSRKRWRDAEIASREEVKSLRARVAVLEAERHTTNEALDDAVGELRTSYAERARRESHPGRRQAWRMLAQAEESERVAEALVSPKASRSADRLRALLAGQREAAAVESGPKCRCGEPGTDPYACEADDCTASFSELNPFAGGPVEGHDAKVSRKCGCGWSTSVWHVDDGSAEEELHGHVTREHDGVYPAKSGGA